MKKITLSVLLLLSVFAFGQTATVSITNLKVLNQAATTVNFGTNVTSVNVSITASVSSSNNTSQGAIMVRYKRNSSTSTTPVIPTNGYDGNFYLLNGFSGSKTFTITLSRSEFDNTGGIVYVEYMPSVSSILSYKSNNISVTKLANPISNNIISGNQTVYEGDPANTISGSTPADGNLTYTYTWQKKTVSGSWTNIAGANSINYSPGITAETTSYRRIVASTGTIDSTSNEVTITIVPVYPIQNNTITLSGSNIQGSIPTGGIGSFTYRWYTYILEGEGWQMMEYTTKDWNIPASVYQFMENLGNSQGLIYREVRSGNKISSSNVVTIYPAQPIENNTIAIEGLNIVGSLPTGGNGDFRYEYYTYLELSDGEIEGPSMIGSEQHYAVGFNAPSVIKYYRRVVSANKSSLSNVVSFPLAKSFSNKSSLSENSITDLTVYPNPTSESLNFSTNFSTDKEIEIFLYSEKLGNEKSVFKGKVTPNQVVNWNIPSSYQKGIYFYKIVSDNKEVKTGKVIFQ